MVLERRRNSASMPTATLWIAQTLPPVSDAISFEVIVPAASFLYRLPKHLVMALEAIDVIGRLKKEAKQIQESG